MDAVRDLLHFKPAKIVIINTGATAYQALLKFDDHGVGALIVTNSEGDLAGIVTERDITKAAKLFGEAFVHRPVSDVMTKKLTTCDIGDSAIHAIKIMEREQVQHLPDSTERK